MRMRLTVRVTGIVIGLRRLLLRRDQSWRLRISSRRGFRTRCDWCCRGVKRRPVFSFALDLEQDVADFQLVARAEQRAASLRITIGERGSVRRPSLESVQLAEQWHGDAFAASGSRIQDRCWLVPRLLSAAEFPRSAATRNAGRQWGRVGWREMPGKSLKTLPRRRKRQWPLRLPESRLRRVISCPVAIH